jgi:hypothetical protein
MMKARCCSRALIASLVFAACLGAAMPSARASERRSQGQLVYVPAYSHIIEGDKERNFNLSVTLSIRNADPEAAVEIVKVDYYNQDGQMVRQYAKSPVSLGPMASTYFFVKESDSTGGLGASFLVKWKSAKPVNSPLIEAILISTRSQQGVSFVSRGVPIEE